MIEKRILKSGKTSWRVRWWHGSSERSKSFSTRREAEHYDRERKQASQSGKYVDPKRGRVLVGEVWREYIASQVHLKEGTRTGYETEYRLRIGPDWGVVAVNKVTREAVQSWVASLMDNVGSSTVRYAHRVLSLILDYAVRTRRISENPAKGINLPRLEKSKRQYLSGSAVQALDTRLRQVTKETAYPDIVTTMALTGLRVGEATGLNVGDFDSDRRRITVRQAYRQIGGKYVMGSPKSRAGYRQVAVPGVVAGIIEPRVRERAPELPLFTTGRGRIVRPENLRRATRWRETVTELGYPGLTLHDLRHTAASLAVQSGANVKVVQRMLGHASAAITLDIYADLFDSELDDVAKRLDSTVGWS